MTGVVRTTSCGSTGCIYCNMYVFTIIRSAGLLLYDEQSLARTLVCILLKKHLEGESYVHMICTLTPIRAAMQTNLWTCTDLSEYSSQQKH